MTVRSMFTGLIMSLALVVPACTADMGDQEMGDELFSVPLDPMGGFGDPTDMPPGSSNGFLPKCFWNRHTIAAYQLYAQSSLWRDASNGDYSLPPNTEIDKLEPACREQALKYLARCVLRKGTYFIDPLTGDMVPGWLGVTDEWATAPLSSEDEWWFTSCVTQHINGFGVEVDLEVDGSMNMKGMLFPAHKEDPNFPLHDSHTYGNMFTTMDRFVLNVCFDRDLELQCGEINTITTRICDTDPSIGCGLNITGPCDAACNWSTTMEGYSCGNAGFRTIGSRLKTFKTYEDECRDTPTDG